MLSNAWLVETQWKLRRSKRLMGKLEAVDKSSIMRRDLTYIDVCVRQYKKSGEDKWLTHIKETIERSLEFFLTVEEELGKTMKTIFCDEANKIFSENNFDRKKLK